MVEQMSSPPTGKPQTVLLVDDDSSMLLLCARKLEEEGFRVLQASGSSEALKACTEHTGHIHLLLADLLLPPPALQLAAQKNPFPRVHGQELVKRIVTMRPQIRVLLMSAHSDEELKSHGIKKGSLPFLQKPFSGESLIQQVRQALASPPVVIEKKDEIQKKGDEKDVQWYD